MKKMISFCAVLLAACAMAEGLDYLTPQPANQPIVTATDTYVGPQGERSDEAGLFRVSAGGFGRFGMDMKYAAGREHLELYGAGVDFQYNLLPEERFNLWVGVGYSYAPEQDACKYTEQYNYSSNGTTWSETYAGKFELKAHDFRLMLIPEWQICEDFALGLRMGVSLGFYDGKLTETYTYADDWGSDSEGPCSYKQDDTVVQGLIGVQATWFFSESVGAYVYCDARFGDDVDLKIDGEKFGKFETSGVEVGVAAVGQF